MNWVVMRRRAGTQFEALKSFDSYKAAAKYVESLIYNDPDTTYFISPAKG